MKRARDEPAVRAPSSTASDEEGEKRKRQLLQASEDERRREQLDEGFAQLRYQLVRNEVRQYVDPAEMRRVHYAKVYAGSADVAIPEFFEISFFLRDTVDPDDMCPVFAARPGRAPVPTGRHLNLHLLYLKQDATTGFGAGHRALTLMEQLVAGLDHADNRPFESALIAQCHFPTFYATDSHFGWEPFSSQALQLPSDTAPFDMYPRYLDRDYASQAPELRNDKTKHKGITLGWSSPQTWFDARLAYWERKSPLRLKAFIAERGLDQVTRYAKQCVFHLVDGDRPSNFDAARVFHALRLQSIPMGRAGRAKLSDATERFLSRASNACLALGNHDTGAFSAILSYELPTEAEWQSYSGSLLHSSPYDARFIFLDQLDFGVLDKVDTDRARLSIQLLLALLVDMCRVFYRPLVVSAQTVAVLTRVLQTGADASYLLDPEYERDDPWLWPRPLPYFVPMDDGSRVFVPRRKPHTTDWATGKTYRPLPAKEPPLLDPVAAAPASAGPRPFEAPTCVHCAATASAFTDGVFTFCGAPCQEAYYRV